MEQVGDLGEIGPEAIQATMEAAVIDTPHENTFNLQYAWEVCRTEHADILVPQGSAVAEDIRWRWTTYENIDQWMTDWKGVLIKYGFAYDRPHVLENGDEAEIKWVEAIKARVICFDETDHPLGNNNLQIFPLNIVNNPNPIQCIISP